MASDATATLKAIAATLEPIKADEVYPLPLFQRNAGMSKHAMRTARRNGLPVKKIGRRKYVLGRDFLEYIAKHGETE